MSQRRMSGHEAFTTFSVDVTAIHGDNRVMARVSLLDIHCQSGRSLRPVEFYMGQVGTRSGKVEDITAEDYAEMAMLALRRALPDLWA